MSELPKCRLCGCNPIHMINGQVKHDEFSSSCSLRLSVLAEKEWRALMAVPGGEAVAYEFRMRPTWSPDQPWSAWSGCIKASYERYQVKRDYGDWEYESRALYEHPAPAVDDAVLRDAERYRWLIRKIGACGPSGNDFDKWKFTFPGSLTLKVSELNVTDIKADFNRAIDAAMEGGA